ncbi:hypothetical protein F5B22DRAFT_619806 [Xylaria bambusicola]|uniref:uncharacterized protein n=1 Tax=Xylaria bambusicola TaxID=326684 RepID=UPI0020074F47|nr:uncharacterized protein F5B22DRAFT_619806 [Xylaria bambusicola]KAI0508644.1 hypothetical protein F5B22DRAFT_619806 [Xylaria bambusicola]
MGVVVDGLELHEGKDLSYVQWDTREVFIPYKYSQRVGDTGHVLAYTQYILTLIVNVFSPQSSLSTIGNLATLGCMPTPLMYIYVFMVE